MKNSKNKKTSSNNGNVTNSTGQLVGKVLRNFFLI